MIKIENITKSFPDKILFDSISFQLTKKEKAGLIGANGSGKSTLFKIIAGLEEADNGKVSIPIGYKIGFVRQNIEFSEKTVIDTAVSFLPEEQSTQKWYAEKILAGLGFDQRMINMDPMLLSGGYQVRLNLAGLILSTPDLLLLDEPTNYLDITTIRWLIGFLRSWEGELLLITHDRGFMDAVVDSTMIIHRQKLKKIKGGTEKLYDQISKEEEIYEEQIANDEKRRAEVERFINRFRSKATLATLVQSRIKMLEKQGKKERLERIKTLDFQFKYRDTHSDPLATVENLSFGYEEDKLLFENISFEIKKDDRIAIIGPNGRGKSTLLRVINGEISPISGLVTHKPACRRGYFAQTNVESLNGNNTVEEEIASSNPEMTITQARSLAGAFLFEQEEAIKKIIVLSGGEKSRVSLAKIAANPINLLMLDEPTNHLDIDSTDALLSSIDNFDGAVILVTHNEMFLKTLANKLIVFDNNTVNYYLWDYNTFLNKKGWSTERPSNEEQTKPVTNQRKLDRKERAEFIEKKNALTRPLKKSIEKLEEKIKIKELRKKEIEEEIIIKSTDHKNGETIVALTKEHSIIEKELETYYDELFDLTEKLEDIELNYET